MSKMHMMILAGSAVAGFFAAKSLVGTKPFTWAYTQGAALAA